QERSTALALTALEVAVRGAHGVLPWRQLVAVHGDAHRAAGLAPVAARRAEDVVEALALRLALHFVRAGHHHQPDAIRNLAAVERRSGQPQVADPAVRAAADEDHVDLLAQQRLAGLEVHVRQRLLEA